MSNQKKPPQASEALSESPVLFVGLSMATLFGLLWVLDTLTRPEPEEYP